MKKMFFIFFGPPWGGKGTQSKIYAQAHNLIVISTGDLCRAQIVAQTDIGKKLEADIANGIYAPDKVIFTLLKEEIAKYPDAIGFVFDGFPRTIEQALYLFDAMLDECNLEFKGGVEMTVTDENLVERFRLAINSGERKDRTDNTENVFYDRLKVYETMSSHVPSYLSITKNLPFFTIDADGTIEEVSQEIEELLKSTWKKSK